MGRSAVWCYHLGMTKLLHSRTQSLHILIGELRRLTFRVIKKKYVLILVILSMNLLSKSSVEFYISFICLFESSLIVLRTFKTRLRNYLFALSTISIHSVSILKIYKLLEQSYCLEFLHVLCFYIVNYTSIWMTSLWDFYGSLLGLNPFFHSMD